LFFFTALPTYQTYPLSLHDALPIFDTESVYALPRIRGWGFDGQFAELGEKHRDGNPSTETRRGRADLDVSAYVGARGADRVGMRSEEHTSELQSRGHLVCRLLLEKK